jgi:DNA-binding transcriptional regulator YhcF (GntR family)
MSAKATNWVWEESQSTGSARLVLLALADWANEKGICFGSYRGLAKKTRLSVATVTRSLRELEAAGEVKQLEPGGFGTADPRKPASDWLLPKVACAQSEHVLNLSTSCAQFEHSTILNNTSPSSSKDKKQTAIPFSTQSLNQPSSSNEKTKVPPRESVLGRGMSDDDWLDHLAKIPKYAGINVRAKFEHLLAWCSKNGEAPTRQRLKVWLDKDAKQQRMSSPASKIVKIVRDDFADLMQELAAG